MNNLAKVVQEVEFKAKADKAIAEIKELNKAIEGATKSLQGNIKLGVDSASVDKELNSLRKQLDGLTAKIKTNFDDKEVTSKIASIRKQLDNIRGKSINIDASSARGAESAISRVASALRGLSGNTSVNMKSSGFEDTTSKAVSLGKILDSITGNKKITTTLEDKGVLSTLGKIRDAIADIKRNSNININARANRIETGLSDGTNRRSRSRLQRHTGGREYEVDDLLRKDNHIDEAPWYAKASSNAIYSIGRASKGFGSALEVAAYQLGELAKNAGTGGASGAIGTFAARILPGIAVLTGVFAAFSSLLSITSSLGHALMQLVSLIYEALKPGIELYVKKSKATYGMAAAIQSQGYVGGKGFKDAYGEASGATSITLSQKLMNKAMLDAEKSVFDFSEIIESLQGTLPMLMSKGMSLDQAYRVNKGIAATAKTLQLAPNQVLQETRDIAQNSITSRSSQVANALHITNDDLKKFGDDVDARFDYLMQKFESYKEMLEEYSNTPVGAFERMQDRLLKVSSDIVENVAPMFMGLFNTITNATGKWVDEMGNEFDIVDNKWKQKGKDYGLDAQKNIVQGGLDVDSEVGEAKFIPTEAIEKLKEALPEIIEMVAELADGFIAFLEQLTGTEDPIDAIIELVKDAIQIFFELARAATWVGDVIVEAFTIMEAPIMAVIRLLQLIGAKVKILYSSFVMLGAGIAKALLSAVDALPSGVKKFFGIDDTGVKESLGRVNNWALNSAKDFKNSVEWNHNLSEKTWSADGYSFQKYLTERYGELSKKGTLTESLEQGMKDLKKTMERQTGAAKKVGLNDVKGNPNPESDEKANKKARQEAIRASQAAMREHIQGLKDALKESLDDLKDILDKNKIAFDEGFMSIKDYYTQKAEIEKQEAELRLQEAQEELKTIQGSQFNNEYEKVKALHDVERAIRENEKKLGNAVDGIRGVSEAIARNEQSRDDMINAVFGYGMPTSSKKSVAVPGQPPAIGLNAENTQGMTNEEIAYRFLTSQGYSDAIARGIIAALKGESLDNPADIHWDVNGYSMGIASWHDVEGTYGRMSALKDFAAANNSDPMHILTQLAYLVKELNDTEKAQFEEALAYYNANGQTAEAMTYAFTKFVERPADKEGEGIGRQRFLPAINDILASANAQNRAASAQQSAAEAMNNASSQMEGVEKTLVSSSGELMGYTPDKEHNFHGFDTRYLNFDDFNESGESLDRVQENVRMAVNLLAKMYYEQTHERLEPTSFTGSDKHSSGGNWGHYQGWKMDVSKLMNKAVLEELLRQFGVGAGWEGDHWDVSFGKGGVGGQQITANSTGEDWYNKMMGARWQSGSLVPGGSYQTKASNTQIESETNKQLEKFNEDILQITADSQSNILDIYGEDYKAALAAKTLQIREKYKKVAKKILTEMPEGEDRDKLLVALKTNFLAELNQAESGLLERRLDYNLKAAKTWGEYAGFETFQRNPGSMDLSTFMQKYMKYFYDDVNNPLSPSFVMDKMWSKVRDFEAIGQVDKAQDLREKILKAFDTLGEIFNQYINQITTYHGNYDKWVDTTDMTSYQKTFAHREIKARENEQKAQVYGTWLEAVNKSLDKYEEQLTNVNNSLAKYIELERLAKDANEKNEYRNKIAILKSEQEGLRLQKQKLVMRGQEIKSAKLLAEEESHQPELMRDLRKEAKQAFADGLNKFLTDGINSANSLGEALKNMIVDFLKSMQKFFADRLTTNLMETLFPTRSAKKYGTDEQGNPQDKYASTMALHGEATSSQIWQGRSKLQNNPLVMTTISPMQGIDISQPNLHPWEKKGAFQVKNSPLDKVDYKGNALNSLTGFGTQLQNATLYLGNFGAGTDSATKATQDMAQSITNSAVGDESGNQIAQITQTIGQNLEMAGQGLVQAINTITNSLGGMGFGGGSMLGGLPITGFGIGGGNRGAKPSLGKHADGGLISGIGTGTSDSIPAMLSNGEFVVKASAVRQMGTNFLNAVNNGNLSKIRAHLPRFADGGTVGDAQQETARGMTSFAEKVGTSVSTTNNMSIAVVDNKEQAMEHFMKTKGERYILDTVRGTGRAFAQMSFSN